MPVRSSFSITPRGRKNVDFETPEIAPLDTQVGQAFLLTIQVFDTNTPGSRAEFYLYGPHEGGSGWRELSTFVAVAPEDGSDASASSTVRVILPPRMRVKVKIKGDYDMKVFAASE